MGYANLAGEHVPFAYPTPGIGDFRVPALIAEGADGATALTLRYRDHLIRAGKPSLDPLPSTYVEDDAEAETLEVPLVDDLTGLEVELRFTIFGGRPLIARSATIRATGEHPVDLRTAMSVVTRSARCGLGHGRTGWRLGARAHVVERPLVPGRQSMSSTHGASSAQHNPFLALRRPDHR